ncbi:hypothetical protein IU429_02860 [Nocardia elegans]|uniref:Helix-turn-helix domain-containing protein n=1 Tax=Nocardia elegans TaxID=300029 RepID=A0ABW6TQS1_9NOCA|nr:hypothetical protein [Nocardia elegans]MBF6446600.1 hypothetical protein [Nocardia elegans]
MSREADPAVPDPATILTRDEFAAALTQLRLAAGLTVRQVVDRSGCLHGTVSGWFAGHHLPTEPNEKMFRDVLSACGVSDPTSQADWLAALRRIRPTTGRRRVHGPVPYRGLEAFEDTDADWFFGRTELARQLQQQVDALCLETRQSRLLIVIGASGCGKSSVLRAGLVPLLRQHGLTAAVVTPGRNPLRSLDAANTADIVVIDQFEEAWSLCTDDAARASFFDRIATGEAVYVLGLRADFYSQAAAERVLHDPLADHAVLIGPLSPQALRDAIVEPARKAGWSVEDQLVQLLLVELAPRGATTGHDPGALPLLSHALLETWHRGSRRRMTVADYNAAGGIAGAIEQSAESVYHHLSARQQQITPRTFLRLVAIDGDTTTRRRADRTELVFSDESQDDVVAIIEQYAAARLLSVDTDTVQISHEALISAWSRLGGWVQANRSGLVVQQQLTRAEQVWHDANHDPNALLGPARLAVIEDWIKQTGREADLNDRERRYIRASQQHYLQQQHRERRRTRVLQRLAAGLAMALVATLVLATVAFTAENSARQARDEAMSRQIAIQAQQLRNRDPALSAQLALAAYRTSPTLEARSTLVDASAIQTPIRLLGPDGGAIVAADHDGTLLAIGHADATISLYRLSVGTPPTALARVLAPQPAAMLNTVAIDSTRHILAGGFRGQILLWDITDASTPKFLSQVGDSATTYKSLALLSTSSPSLIAGTAGTSIERWDTTNPAEPVRLSPLDLPAAAPIISASADGKLLAAAGQAGSLRIWDSTTQEPRLITDKPAIPGDTAQALAVRFSPAGDLLAVSGRANQVQLWNVSDPGHPVERPALSGFSSYVNDVAFSPDGTQIAAGSSDNTTQIWQTASLSPPYTLQNPAIVVSVQFVLGGRLLVTGSVDGTTRLWPLPGPILRGAQSIIFQAPTDRKGTELLLGAGSKDGHAHLWKISDPLSPVEFPPLDGGPGQTTCGAVGMTNDGALAAVGTPTGAVALWDIRDPTHPIRRANMQATAGIVGSIAFSPDATLLVVASQDNPSISLWDIHDLAAPQQISTIDAGPGLPGSMTISPNGTLLAIPTSDDVVRLWDLHDQRHVTELRRLVGFSNDVTSSAISPSNTMLAAGSSDHTIRIFDISTPSDAKQLSTLVGPTDAVADVSFSADAQSLVASASDSGVWVWNIGKPSRPRRTVVLNAYTGRVNDAAFGSGGSVLIGAGTDKIARLWNLDPDQVSDRLCRSGTDLLTLDEWNRYLPGVPQRRLCP